MVEKEPKEMRRWKKAVILGMTFIFGLSTSALAPSEKKVMSAPVKEVVLPDGFDYLEGRDLGKIIEENPVSDSFFTALHDFSYETVAEIFSKNDKNLNYSPLSLYYALALATSGAEEETLDELLALLRVKDQHTLLEEAGNLYQWLYLDNDIGQLKIANSIWMNKDVVWKEPFVSNAVEHLYATSHVMDFQDEKTETAMEEWIKNQTKGTLNPEINLDQEAIMSILNTVYFYDEWTDAFLEKETKEDRFYLANGIEEKVDFMHRHLFSHGFVKGEGFTRSSLQLKNSSSMVFILPEEGITPKELLSTPEHVKRIFEEGEDGFGEVIWQIPKFSFGSRIELKETLQTLGVQSAFEENANFRGITDQIAYIQGIHQETHLGIDEKGVEASAYTQIDYSGAAQPIGKAEMILNRPFIYGIKASNGTLLFVGVCENPTLR